MLINELERLFLLNADEFHAQRKTAYMRHLRLRFMRPCQFFRSQSYRNENSGIDNFQMVVIWQLQLRHLEFCNLYACEQD